MHPRRAAGESATRGARQATSSSRTTSGAPPSNTPHRSAAGTRRPGVSSSPGATQRRAASRRLPVLTVADSTWLAAGHATAAEFVPQPSLPGFGLRYPRNRKALLKQVWVGWLHLLSLHYQALLKQVWVESEPIRRVHEARLTAKRQLGTDPRIPLPGRACGGLLRMWGGVATGRPACQRATRVLRVCRA